MKILFHTPTATLKPYPRADDEPVVGLDAEYEIFDVVQEDQPVFDPATQWVEGTESIDTGLKTVTRGWQVHSLPDFKTWANVQLFMAEFTMEEKAMIALSTDPTLAALRLELSTWLSEVYANDPRVVTGINKLVELSIVSQVRADEILAV